jgi:hypothetical protein
MLDLIIMFLMFLFDRILIRPILSALVSLGQEGEGNSGLGQQRGREGEPDGR